MVLEESAGERGQGAQGDAVGVPWCWGAVRRAVGGVAAGCALGRSRWGAAELGGGRRSAASVSRWWAGAL